MKKYFTLLKKIEQKKLKLIILIFIILIKTIKHSFYSDKWIIMTVSNPPNPSILNIFKILKGWNLVAISINNKIDKVWESLNYINKIFYLSLRKQNNLGYKILKFLKKNTYSRKNIGYIYAIQHGAKEIFEMDEYIIISDLSNLNINYNNDWICYGIRNDSSMINPYSYFNKKNLNLWPRGFSLSDLKKDYDTKFYVSNPNNLLLKPLIYQGIINGIPDIDSIFQKINKVQLSTQIEFINNYPLVYFPGKYIPINSKSTKYLYEIFPFLLLPTTVNERISDIWRGYIMQYFAWRYEGCVVYHISKNYIKEYNISYQSKYFELEKNLYFNLNKFIDVLNADSNLEFNNPFDLLYKIVNDLAQFKLLGKNEINIYKAFLEDLSNVGYSFSIKFKKKIDYNYQNFIKEYSKFNYYFPSDPITTINNRNNRFIKIINHYNSINKYSNILLIINYNNYFGNLNDYISNLYKHFFPNIVFISPNENSTKGIISCKESYYGYYSYICLEKIYLKYPNFKGYLFINDDGFMKEWELDNLNFDTPWFYLFENISKFWPHYSKCINTYKLLNLNKTWKANLIKFHGSFEILFSNADFYYIPNSIISQFCQIVKEMYKVNIFLECAVPTAMAIILSKEYQLIYFKGLWSKDERGKAIIYLKKEFKQITIHPIKFSNITHQYEVDRYIYFINAKLY